MKTTAYQKDLIESLKDPSEAAAYLNAAIDGGTALCFFWLYGTLPGLMEA